MTPSTSGVQPVRNDTRRSAAIDAVRQAVLSGAFAPGDRVKEVELAAALAISRPTLREAIQQLVHEGFLTVEPYKGVRVAKPSAAELRDMAQVRASLETQAAQAIAEQADGRGLDRLTTALERHLAGLDTGDPIASDRTHLQFHFDLWAAAENTMLLRIWPIVKSQIQIAMIVDQPTRDHPDRDRLMHQRLVDVIGTGSANDIAAEVRKHILRPNVDRRAHAPK